MERVAPSLPDRTVDIHCHLLPGVDDGCDSVEEAYSILEEMTKNGTGRVYLTPHLFSPRVKSSIGEIRDAFERLQESYTDKYPELVLGSEVFLVPEIVELEFIPMGSTRFVLVELPVDTRPRFLHHALRSLQEEGYVVILAHVERYRYLYSSKTPLVDLFTKRERFHEIIKLRNDGILFQVNWHSLINPGKHERSLVRYLLNSGFVDFVGSDKHSANDGRSLINHSHPYYAQTRNSELL
ncbi:MAG TPA: capsular biosynthesis protein [Kosmotogaceae bacterium]|nr:MAG: Capsular polysaccharide biosynthesis protein [Thermotogales bacterium 46_20]HAA86455.1 capsular biosynthesis protein [Kosmotogaceae bacterium]